MYFEHTGEEDTTQSSPSRSQGSRQTSKGEAKKEVIRIRGRYFHFPAVFVFSRPLEGRPSRPFIPRFLAPLAVVAFLTETDFLRKEECGNFSQNFPKRYNSFSQDNQLGYCAEVIIAKPHHTSGIFYFTLLEQLQSFKSLAHFGKFLLHFVGAVTKFQNFRENLETTLVPPCGGFIQYKTFQKIPHPMLLPSAQQGVTIQTGETVLGAQRYCHLREEMSSVDTKIMEP